MLAGLTAVATMLAGCSGGEPRPKNLILISVDTLRADRLGCYGYERPTSPAIDAFATRGVLFEDASTPSPWTLPAHASLFTGLYPRRNGVTGMRFTMSKRVPTLAELLAKRGYATGAVVTNSLLSTNGLDRGFASHAQVDKGGPHPSDVTRESIAWLDERDPERPFFLLVHYIDPHTDYATLADNQARFVEPYEGEIQGTSKELYRVVEGRLTLDEEDRKHLSNLYDGAVRQMDSQVEELLAYLERAGLTDDTLILLTSDHGEEFFEHGGVLHGLTQFDEVVRVPFVLAGPGVPTGRRVTTPVSLIDVVPTCLDLLGLRPPADVDGLSLRPLLDPGGRLPPRRLFYEADLNGSMEGAMLKGTDRAVRDGRFKLHYDQRSKSVSLFDLEADPRERVDVHDDHPELARELLQALMDFLAAGSETPSRQLTEEDLERMRALGYAAER